MRTLAFFIPSRLHLACAAALAAIGLVVCFVPLFNLIGYESAALFGVLGGVVAMGCTVASFGRERLPSPLVDLDVSPVERWGRMTARHLAYLVVPFLLVAANSLRVVNCDPAQGIFFWLVIPVLSVAFGTALGLAVASATWGRRWAGRWLVVGIFVATVADFALRLAFEPPIIGYHLFLGYFSGSIYDEALSLPAGLIAYRLIQIVGFMALLALMQWKWNAEREGRSRRWIVAASVLALLWAGTFAERDRWDIDLDSEEVAERLGGRVESEHFVIFYPNQARFEAAEVARLVEDHEYRYDEMSRFFGTDPVATHGEKVRSFVYADRPQKGFLIGARRTLVAKIWLGEMHILWRHYGDHMLAHELAHVFTEPFAGGPLRLSTRWGVGINMGLVEGAATAADWHSSELTPHQSSAALQRLDRAPDLRRMVGASGFWTQSSGRAYTLVGSFIRWLVETRGIEKFRAAYPHGDFEGAYGVSVDELVTEWERFLAGIELGQSDLERARFLYDRPTIFEKVCARTIGELRFEAGQAAAAGEVGGVRERYEQILGFAPRNVGYRLEFARTLLQVDAIDEARAEVTRLVEGEELTPSETAQALHLLGDMAWRQGELAPAGRYYQNALSSGLPSDYERLIGAKLLVLERDERTRALGRAYFIDDPESPIAMYYPTRWRGEAPDDALAAYLVGRRLWSVNEFEEALAHLQFAEGRLPAGALDWENTRMLAQTHYWLGDAAAARPRLERLSSVERATYSVEADEWLDRIEWRARNRLQELGGLEP